MYGGSTTQAPSQPKKIKLKTKHQKKNWATFKNLLLLHLNIPTKGKKNKIIIAENIAITPPNLSGIERNIA